MNAQKFFEQVSELVNASFASKILDVIKAKTQTAQAVEGLAKMVYETIQTMVKQKEKVTVAGALARAFPE